jgi:hypothetical protein
MAEADTDLQTQQFLSELPSLMTFKVGGPPTASKIPPRRYRNHIYLLEPYMGHGITREPGDFLCLGGRYIEPELFEFGALPITCAECLRSVRRIFRQRMGWRERRAMVC